MLSSLMWIVNLIFLKVAQFALFTFSPHSTGSGTGLWRVARIFNWNGTCVCLTKEINSTNHSAKYNVSFNLMINVYIISVKVKIAMSISAPLKFSAACDVLKRREIKIVIDNFKILHFMIRIKYWSMNRRGGLYGGFVSASSTSSNFKSAAQNANDRQVSTTAMKAKAPGNWENWHKYY